MAYQSNIFNPLTSAGGYTQTGTTTTTGDFSGAMGPGGLGPTMGAGAGQANLSAIPYNQSVSDWVNATNRAAQQAANASRLGPQGQQIQQNLMTNAERASAGLLDPQTEQMLRSGIAASGQYRGFGVDSPALAAAYRRALGQDITGTEQLGQQNYLQLLAANPSAPIYDAGNMVITPSQYAQAVLGQAGLNRTVNTTQTGTDYRLNPNPYQVGGGNMPYQPVYRGSPSPVSDPTDYGSAFTPAPVFTPPQNRPVTPWTPGNAPPNTAYDPLTDTSYNTYGQEPFDWMNLPPENTGYNPVTDQSYNTYGLDDWSLYE